MPPVRVIPTPNKTLRISPSTSRIPQSEPSNNRKKLLSQPKHSLTPQCSTDRHTTSLLKKRQLFGNVTSPRDEQVVKAFSTAMPDRLPCRESEIDQIYSFIDNHVTKGEGASLYLCGCPGTGKTACLTHVLSKLRACMDLEDTILNCMNIRQEKHLFELWCDSLGVVVSKKSSRLQYVQALCKFMTKSNTATILVLDEMDQLESVADGLLSCLFELSSKVGNKLILIGIANSLDLAQRRLSRFEPLVLQFQPYKPKQIETILRDRLQCSDLFEPSAITLCSRKVSAVTGDIRKALDICKIAATKRSVARCGLDENGRLGISEITNALNDVYMNKIDPNTIPFQQAIVLACLLRVVRSGVNQVTFEQVYSTYVNVCRSHKFTLCSHDECLNMCDLLESQGKLSQKKIKKKGSLVVEICLLAEESMIETALGDRAVLSSVLTI